MKLNNNVEKPFFGCGIATILIIILWLVGEILCIPKFINSDFKAPYKREVLYGIGIVSPVGGIIGWFNIKDN